jgi:NAD-dependent deacetylase
LLRDDLRAAARILRSATNLMVLTGAGISRESGIPTFRDRDGLWNRYDPAELASIGALREDPLRVWRWYNWRRSRVLEARPNAGHRALADLEAEKAPGFLLVTQNVDGLHRRAGSRAVVEIHGDIFEEVCPGCGTRRRVDAVRPDAELPVRCATCGGIAKPGVVMFGEPLPVPGLRRVGAFMERADAILVVGTSAVVQPVASFPFAVAAHGGRIVEINPEETPVTPAADVSLRGPAGGILPGLVGFVLREP